MANLLDAAAAIGASETVLPSCEQWATDERVRIIHDTYVSDGAGGAGLALQVCVCACACGACVCV